ncbi:hypothetical protein JQN58_18565 [Aneurinibacillus sp. BA2021]|nr:hypothetical protein [Aneurinibacillus sp. BA2021]
MAGYTVVLFVTYLLFYYSPVIVSKMRQNSLNVITRLMGLILAVMAIQMIATGVKGLSSFHCTLCRSVYTLSIELSNIFDPYLHMALDIKRRIEALPI